MSAQVVEHASEDYGEISEILNRHRTLKDAHTDLKRNSKAAELKSEANRLKFTQYTKERTNEILNFNNKLSVLRKNIDHQEAARIGLQNKACGAQTISVDHDARL